MTNSDKMTHDHYQVKKKGHSKMRKTQIQRPELR